jgi:hypothetical protein
MVRNDRRPADGTADPLENVAASQVDIFQIAPQPFEIQQNRIRARINVSDVVANVIAGHAYGVSETWGAQA